MIRVQLPPSLQTLANTGIEVTLEVAAPVTLAALLDALEARYPALCGTIRHHETRERRPLIRFFACDRDLTHQSPQTPLPDPVVAGKEPLVVVGAIAGG